MSPAQRKLPGMAVPHAQINQDRLVLWITVPLLMSGWIAQHIILSAAESTLVQLEFHLSIPEQCRLSGTSRGVHEIVPSWSQWFFSRVSVPVDWSGSERRALLRQLLFTGLALCWCVLITSAFPARMCFILLAPESQLPFLASPCSVRSEHAHLDLNRSIEEEMFCFPWERRLHFSEYPLRSLFWHVKAFQIATTNLIYWILALRKALLTEGYPSAVLWELLPQGMGAVKAELAGAMLK